jgi:hypothetical protein
MLPSSFEDLKKQILENSKLDQASYRNLPLELKNNEDITLAFLKKMPWLIKIAPEKFTSNKELLLSLMEKDPWTFTAASKALKEDMDFVIESIEKTKGLAYFLCAPPMVSKPQVMEAARAQGLRLHS